MISKNDILNFVKHVHKRGRGIPDRRPMHPRREWLIGVFIALVAIVLGVIYSVQTFAVYNDIDKRTYTIDVQIPTYNQPVAQAVLKNYASRNEAYQNLINQIEVMPVVEERELSLVDTAWKWVSTVQDSNDILKPNELDVFVLTFTGDGKFSATTDCNNLFGDYVQDGEILSIGPIAATKKFCGTDTKESAYLLQLSEATSFVIEAEQLQINLYKDAGTMLFVADDRGSESGE